MQVRPRDRPGFSLIEALIVIAILTVLIALTIPTLSSVRLAASDLRSLSNIRSHGQVFAVYQTDWDDWFPQFADPQADYSVVRDRQISVVFEYFAGVVWWPIALSDDYFDGAVLGNDDLFLHDYSEEGRFNIYNLSSALMAQPAYWNRETRIGPSQWGGCRVSQISFPAQKAQLVEWHPNRRLPFATETYVSDVGGIGLSLCDGSAGRYHTREMVAPYPFGDGSGPGTYQPIGIFGMHTVNGWLGRDVK